MAYNVRVYGYRGIVQMKNVLPKQYSADSVFQLDQPFEWGQVISVSAVAASSAAVNAVNDRVEIIRIEVPDGQSVRYEINPPTRTGGVLVASTLSPIMSGQNQFRFMPGWTVSLIDAAGLP